MNGWLLGVVGVVFLGVLFDLIYPKGKTNSLCKNIFGVFALFVMISPILKVNVDKLIDITNSGVLIESIHTAGDDRYKSKILSHLEECNITGVSVEIDSKIENDKYVITNIYVDSTNMVLTENITNINKYEVIANKIASIVDIELERIIVYG